MFERAKGWLIAAVVTAIGATPACLLELEEDISCGDGFIDRAAGEDCEPSLSESFIDACLGTARPEGVGACNPQTCQVENDRAQCAICGDDRVDSEVGEECDGGRLKGTACPGGGVLRCAADCKFDYSLCNLCGNGMVDEDEECDVDGPGGFVVPRPCAGSDTLEPLTPFWADKPYTSGEVTTCNPATCRHDRIQCGYCGDGVRDGETSVDPGGVVAPAEWCDGGDKDSDRLDEFGGGLCPTQGEQPNVACGADCSSFEQRDGEPLCCKRSGANCASVVDPIKCCYAYDHPGEVACKETFDGPNLSLTCK